jgi:hypothetical protein
MKQSTFYYLLRRGLFRSAMSVVREGLVMFNKFTTAGISHPAQGSAEFDGSSDYIQLDTPFSYTNHTIAAWVYPNNTANQKYIFDNRDAANDGIVLISWSDERILYQINGTNIFSTDTIINDWVFVVATYDGTTQKLYFDGSLQGSQATSKTIDVAFNAVIGRSGYSASDYYNGNLANVAIWNRALTSDEINAVMWKGYQSLTDNEKSGLQAWYSLDDVASPAASLATMEALAVDKDATIENKAAVTAAINALS